MDLLRITSFTKFGLVLIFQKPVDRGLLDFDAANIPLDKSIKPIRDRDREPTMELSAVAIALSA
jgi:hypothetical protein